MCGIAGIFSFKEQVDPRRVKKMTDSLFHRGPDGEGLWMNHNGQIALGHRRLSIIDLSKQAAQPMHLNNRFTITYNGEIYNYKELRNELAHSGHLFKTESDTEVLINAYAFWGENMLEHLDGMFAFAIWDNEKQELFCARDRFGEKPFYFHHSGTEFFFASEMKALWQAGIEKSMNDEMIYRFLVYEQLRNENALEQTFYKNIFSLEAAHSLRITREGQIVKKRYWQLNYTENKTNDFELAILNYRELLIDSVKKRMRSDVEIGCSLSGGVDSSAILSLMNLNKTEGQSFQSFSARFRNSTMDEGEFIASITDTTNTKNFETEVNEDAWIHDFELMCFHQEEPFYTTSPLAQFEIYKLAKAHQTTVLLDGQGADEILAGYTHYFSPYLRELYNGGNKNEFEKQKEVIESLHQINFSIDLNWKLQNKIPGLFKEASVLKQKWKLKEEFDYLTTEFVLDHKLKRPEYYLPLKLNRALYQSATGAGLQNLLRCADRNSMAHSREVRLPFLSHRLVEFLFTLPASFKINEGYTKWIHRKAMNEIVAPKNNWRSSKLGFSPPENSWRKHKRIIEKQTDAIEKLKQKKILKSNAVIPDSKFWAIMVLAEQLN